MQRKFLPHMATLILAAMLVTACGEGATQTNTGGNNGAGAAPATTAVAGSATTVPPAAAAATAAPAPTTAPTPLPTVLSIGSVYQFVTPEGVHTLGTENAPVTVSFYGDVQCTECGNYVLNIEPQLIEQFVKPGRAKLEYHHFIANGTNSQTAAEAISCAGEQGAFWDLRTALYQNQSQVIVQPDITPILTNILRQFNVDQTRFTACRQERELIGEVLEDTSEAQEKGVTAPGTVIVNGTKLEAPVSFEQIAQAIEAAN